MAWKNVFDYVRGIAGKKGMDGKARREDEDLPMGARIGSVVQLQRSPIIRAQTNGSLIVMPADGDTRILAVSQIKLNLAGALYRFYLAKGDDDAKEKFLQVYSDADGKVAEIMYCTQLARVIPETVEDQDAYTGVSGAGLGDQTYTLWREQLADTLGEQDLINVFGDEDRIDYTRDAGDTQAAFVAPFSGKETRIDDAAGMQGLQQEMYFMPYVRELPGGGREYLVITTEIIASVNGDTSKRGIHVDFVIGIPVEQERIVLQ
jgi:hypothetical protein